MDASQFWAQAKDIVVFWLSWQFLDWLRAAGLGALVSFAGWLIARYRASPLQKELRGALIGFLALTVGLALFSKAQETTGTARSVQIGAPKAGVSASVRVTPLHAAISSYYVYGVTAAVLIVATILVIRKRRISSAKETTPASSRPSATELRLSVGRMQANFARLSEDGYVIFEIAAFPSPWGLKLEGQLSGKVHYSERLLLADGSSKPGEMATLDTPQLEPGEFGCKNLGAEGTWITLRQHVSSAVRSKILEALDRPNTVLTFDFDDLVIMVSSLAGSEPQRLPLWNGLTCSEGMRFGQVKKFSAHIDSRTAAKLN
jgi:hypothetical protein